MEFKTTGNLYQAAVATTAVLLATFAAVGNASNSGSGNSGEINSNGTMPETIITLLSDASAVWTSKTSISRTRRTKPLCRASLRCPTRLSTAATVRTRSSSAPVARGAEGNCVVLDMQPRVTYDPNTQEFTVVFRNSVEERRTIIVQCGNTSSTEGEQTGETITYTSESVCAEEITATLPHCTFGDENQGECTWPLWMLLLIIFFGLLLIAAALGGLFMSLAGGK